MRRLGLWATVLVLLGVLAFAILGSVGAAGPSALARGPAGWLAARLYLEARGGEALLLDRPFAPDRVAGAMVTALPWSRLELAPDHGALRAWVEAGGTLLIAYSGRGDQEAELLEAFGLESAKARRDPPWGFLGWRRWVNEDWSLSPVGDLGEGARPVVVRAVDRLPSAPPRARVLYRREETGAPVVWSLGRGEGRLVLLPAGAFANARLAEPGNADLLETLIGWLGGRWTFDEYHHGLAGAEVAAGRRVPLAFDLFGLHLLLLYLLAVGALGRRFGAPWREPPVRSGSAGGFLVGLGRLHDGLGHHAAAAERLLARARELEPLLALPPALGERARWAGARELVAIAREVAALRRGERSAR